MSSLPSTSVVAVMETPVPLRLVSLTTIWLTFPPWSSWSYVIDHV